VGPPSLACLVRDLVLPDWVVFVAGPRRWMGAFARGERPPPGKSRLEQRILDRFKHQRGEHRVEPGPVVVGRGAAQHVKRAGLLELALDEELVVERDHFFAPAAGARGPGLACRRRPGLGASLGLGRGSRSRLGWSLRMGSKSEAHATEKRGECQAPRDPGGPTDQCPGTSGHGTAVSGRGERDHPCVIQRSEDKVPRS
jgi:hypothetical protein